MGKIVTGLFTSLDGIVDADDDWQYAYFDEELFAGITAGWDRAGALLLDRCSFEGYERLRVEHPDSPMCSVLEATPTYVVSSTLDEFQRDGVTVIGCERGRINRLRDETTGDVLVLGSPTLVRWLLAEDLPLSLAASTALRSGVLELRYTHPALSVS